MTLGGDFATNFVCPHCDCKTPIKQIFLEQDLVDLNTFYHLGQCQNEDCEKLIMFVYERKKTSTRILSAGAKVPVKLVHHYPTSEVSLHQSIPPNVAESYAEGVRCMGVSGNKAAVLMFRRALQEICEDKGADSNKKLNEQIDEIIPNDLSDLSHEIRKWGNIGGHPDDLIKDVQPDDSKEMKELIDRMFDFLYVMPWKVQQSRAKRQGT